ncbi:MAG: hypothetical protein M3Y21_05870 [Candidatus Eremiobacteraeota bacterium]|nr:hypothetical protein [Candidatus Eremiobacteraeota bacterium]
MTMRKVLAAVLFGGASLLAGHLTAHAAVEFCPLRVSSMDEVSSTAQTGTYRYIVASDAPGSAVMKGTVLLYGAKRLYRVPFSNISLHQATHDFNAKQDRMIGRYTQFESTALLVTLPDSTKLGSAWVEGVTSDGKHTECPTIPTGVSHEKRPISVTADAAVTSSAKLINTVDTGTCSQDFVAAKPLKLVAPDFPRIAVESTSQPLLVVVKMALDSAAHPYPWVWITSGNALVDAAAIAAARKSTYTAAQFLCQPVAGVYVFTAEFDP